MKKHQLDTGTIKNTFDSINTITPKLLRNTRTGPLLKYLILLSYNGKRKIHLKRLLLLKKTNSLRKNSFLKFQEECFSKNTENLHGHNAK